MLKTLTSVSSLLLLNLTSANAAVFINEIHYDNAGGDTGEFVELVGPAGTDLTGWELVFYNGSSTQLKPYAAVSLSGTLGDDTNTGYGFHSVFQSGIQNGSPDGMALVDAGGAVVQFLSYEGIFTAAEGVAAGMSSTDIGVSESSSNPVGESMQLQGSGSLYSDFSWVSGVAQTPGAVNVEQSINLSLIHI